MTGTENRKDRMREQVLEDLFRQASVRERPALEDEQQIRASLREQWLDMTKGRRRRNRLFFAAAASIAIAVFSATMSMRAPTTMEPGIEVASVEVIKGDIRVRSAADDSGSSLVAQEMLETGQEVSTAHGAGLLAFWRNGISLRIDQNSRVKVTSETELQLISGRVYIDTHGAHGPSAGLSLVTPAGLVRHVGTRYMVAVNLGSTRVSVREGQVLLGDGDEAAEGGERLVFSASGEHRREAVSTYGEDWSWAENLAQPFASDGRTVSEFLSWVGRESGRVIQYASPVAESLAGETRLRGDIDLGPMQALELVMQGTDLDSDLQDGTIVVSADPSK